MIERLARIASHLGRFRRPLWLIAALGVGVFLFRLLATEGQAIEADATALGSLLGFLWALLLVTIAGIFGSVPVARPEDGWLRRVNVWIRLQGYRVLAALCVLLALGVLVLSYQLVRVMGP